MPKIGKANMAINNKIAKYAQGERALERPPGPSSGSRQAGLYLLALRSRIAHAEHLVPGRKLIIPIEPAAHFDARPEIVKITRA